MSDNIRPQKKKVVTGVTRRQFAKRAAVLAGGTSLAGVLPAFWTTANAADTLKVGFISPRSGALAGFGEPDPYVISLVRKALADGFAIGGRPIR